MVIAIFHLIVDIFFALNLLPTNGEHYNQIFSFKNFLMKKASNKIDTTYDNEVAIAAPNIPHKGMAIILNMTLLASTQNI